MICPVGRHDLVQPALQPRQLGFQISVVGANDVVDEQAGRSFAPVALAVRSAGRCLLEFGLEVRRRKAPRLAGFGKRNFFGVAKKFSSAIRPHERNHFASDLCEGNAETDAFFGEQTCFEEQLAGNQIS